MNLANVTAASLGKQIGKEVPEVAVIIAKHAVAGLDSQALADLIGVDASEIQALEDDPVYQEVRGIIGALMAEATADQGLIWDAIEDIAGRRLLERIERETDPEFLLKAAATANRMTRRNDKSNVLEPGLTGRAVAIKLTRRMVERITGDGTRIEAVEEKLSIHDGSMTNPHFDEVNQFLGLNPVKIQAPADASLLADMGFEEAA